MRNVKLGLSLLIAFLLSFSLAVPALAKENPTPVVIKATEVFQADTFKAAEDLVFSGKVNGDLFLAGGMVTFDGETTGDLFIGGGKVIVKGKIGQNLRVGGGQVSVDAKIGRNLLVIGGGVELSENASVNGSLLALGGTLDNLAKINLGGNLFAGRLYQNGQFGKKVNLIADQFILGPKTKITGDLTYKTTLELTPDEQKQIIGKAQFSKLEKTSPSAPILDQSKLPIAGIAQIIGKVMIGLKIISLFWTFVLGIVILKLFPCFSACLLGSIQEKPAKHFLKGLFYWLAIPCVFIITAISLIGLPLIPLLIGIVGLIHLLAKVFGPLVIGQLVFSQVFNQERRGWALLVGLTVTFVISSVPFLGGLFLMVLNGVATGVIVNNFYQGLKNSQKCCCKSC